MRGLLILALCAVSAQAFVQNYGPTYIHTSTGQVPPKNPLTADDRQASRKAKTFVNFIKIVPQLNPLLAPKLGPYFVELSDINFSGELYLENLEVNGINAVGLNFLEVRMAPSRVDFNATVHQISAQVSFDLQASLGNQPINVQGSTTLTLYNLELLVAVGTVVEPSKLGPVYQVNSADVDINIGSIAIEMNMNQYEEDFAVILNAFLQYPSEYNGVIEGLLTTVLGVINKELENVTAKEIITYLLGPGKVPLRG